MDPITIQIIGVAIAAYSAGLATYKPISEWYTSKVRRLDITAKIPEDAENVIDFKERADGKDGGRIYYFEFVNPLEENVKLIVTSMSNRTIVLHSYGISAYIKDDHRYGDIKTWDVNKVLKSKDSITIFIQISEILNNIKLAGDDFTKTDHKLFVIDEKNKKYTCSFEFNYDYWCGLGDKYRVLKDYYEKSPEKFSEGLSKTIHMMANEIEKTGDLKNIEVYLSPKLKIRLRNHD